MISKILSALSFLFLIPIFFQAAPAMACSNACECRSEGGKIFFYAGGQKLKDFHSWSDSGIECARYMASQDYCGNVVSRSPCECRNEGGKIFFYVGGQKIKDFHSWSDSGIECARHMASQNYCR